MNNKCIYYVEGPLDDSFILQGKKDLFRNLLSTGEVDNLNGLAVYTVSKE